MPEVIKAIRLEIAYNVLHVLSLERSWLWAHGYRYDFFSRERAVYCCDDLLEAVFCNKPCLSGCRQHALAIERFKNERSL